MILYHQKLGTELKKYGFDILLEDNRSHQVFKKLKTEFPKLEEVDLSQVKPMTREDLAYVHDKDFLDRWFKDETFLKEIEKTYECTRANLGLELSGLRDNILLQMGATYHGFKSSLESDFCYYLGGGMHHGRADQGSGFCPLNDIIVAIKKAQREQLVKRVLVIDIDAHRGDGTALLAQDDRSIYTFCIHGERCWPEGTELSVVDSDTDITVATNDNRSYLKQLKEGFSGLDLHHQNEAFDAVFVVGGVDPYEGDLIQSAQNLKLTKEEMLARDMIVYKWAKERSLPQFWVMAGGYGPAAPDLYAQFLFKILYFMG